MVALQAKYHFYQDSQVTLPFQDGQQDLEFDSSAAQLVKIVNRQTDRHEQVIEATLALL